VRDDESGDSEDELPCVIRGEREGDSIWRGSRAYKPGETVVCLRIDLNTVRQGREFQITETTSGEVTVILL